MTTQADSPTDVIEQLRAQLDGRVVAPGDADYDTVKRVFLPTYDDVQPAVVVRPATSADVARAVTAARESGLSVAVRCGGHSAVGYGTVKDGLVIDLRDLRSIEVDVEAQTVWAGAGLTAAAYTEEVGKHGLATGFGDTGSVGIGGITLGGGIGFLARKFGLTIDDLLAVEMVTADGQIRHVDAEHEPDLFWAIRGGGGNFGVVTRFQFRAHALPEIVGGMLILPATAEVVAGFIAAADAAPEELSTIANVMNCPPMPFVPAEIHGQLVVMALMAYAGDAASGEQVLAPFRALATPHADMLRPMRYPEIYMPEDPDYRPTAVVRTMFIDHVDLDLATTILETLQASTATMRVAQLRVLGGAIARVPGDATAYAHRTSRIMANVAAFYDGPDDRVEKLAWAESFAETLRQSDTGAYVNFLGDEPARLRAAYPGATWDRLATVKAEYDPTNLFRGNQNIPPAA